MYTVVCMCVSLGGCVGVCMYVYICHAYLYVLLLTIMQTILIYM